MTDPIEFRPRSQPMEERDQELAAPVEPVPLRRGLPSNEVYARVGDAVLRTAHDGVQRHLPVEDIIREIGETHGVHLSVGELRLLLASRRI